jgi:RNA 2',3'-cyclic 3'-phosphodiesterase
MAGETVRLFFAVEIPPEVQAALGRVRGAESGDYRWVDPLLLHVTLAFLGEQPEARLADVQAVGSAAARGSRGGVLELGEPGSFGARSAPRVLWIGLAGDLAALQALQTRLVLGLRQSGFGLEERPFRPHVTLARRRAAARSGKPEGWPPTHPPSPNTFAMQHLTLFQSKLSPRGPSYTALFQFPCEAAK